MNVTKFVYISNQEHLQKWLNLLFSISVALLLMFINKYWYNWITLGTFQKMVWNLTQCTIWDTFTNSAVATCLINNLWYHTLHTSHNLCMHDICCMSCVNKANGLCKDNLNSVGSSSQSNKSNKRKWNENTKHNSTHYHKTDPTKAIFLDLAAFCIYFLSC